VVAINYVLGAQVRVVRLRVVVVVVNISYLSMELLHILAKQLDVHLQDFDGVVEVLQGLDLLALDDILQLLSRVLNIVLDR